MSLTEAAGASFDGQTCKIGTVLENRRVVVGVSPDTGFVMSIDPAGLAGKERKSWYGAQKEAGTMCKQQGDKTIRLPSAREMTVILNSLSDANAGPAYKKMFLFKSRNFPLVRCWTGSDFEDLKNIAITQYFNKSGEQSTLLKCMPDAFALYVRSEPSLVLEA